MGKTEGSNEALADKRSNGKASMNREPLSGADHRRTVRQDDPLPYCPTDSKRNTGDVLANEWR